MRICKIKRCNKKHYGKGYCRFHWVHFIWYWKNRDRIIQYQKKYKLKHYGIGNKYHKCKIKGCNVGIESSKKYCRKHQYRKDHNLPIDLSLNLRGHYTKGERNFMWKGGVAEYPNHYLMKKNRLLILLQNPRCKFCNKKATNIHHIDGNKSNHDLSNLVAVCCKCHIHQHILLGTHWGRPKKVLTNLTTYAI